MTRWSKKGFLNNYLGGSIEEFYGVREPGLNDSFIRFPSCYLSWVRETKFFVKIVFIFYLREEILYRQILKGVRDRTQNGLRISGLKEQF